MLSQKFTELKESIHFLHVVELKNLADSLNLQIQGKKLELIIRIIHFLQTGEKLVALKIPAISCAKKYIVENAANLVSLPPQGSFIMALPIKIKD